jgi:hypothetical protein
VAALPSARDMQWGRPCRQAGQAAPEGLVPDLKEAVRSGNAADMSTWFLADLWTT